ncbi:ISL3 family transposase [Nonomuraea sp. NPDC050663]|uniref:ISL3 family transposase n=1 Tax=Nonomuraea sp. NPDC050663 TaxID=3364370 RepID=UPI00379D7717
MIKSIAAVVISGLVEVLFPHLGGLLVEKVFRSGRTVRVWARTGTVIAGCPGCDVVSSRVHSRYERQLADTAIGGQEVLIHLEVRRFFCVDPTCPRKTFAEQVPGLTSHYGRRSTSLGGLLREVALALGGRAGARLCERIAAAVSRMTLIRMIRGLPDAASTVGPRVLGVDDFALRRGHTYGTILIDLTTGRPIDVLPDRTADTLATWLKAHPGVEIICRDRAGAYAEGAARGAPDAIQVADRWHMWRNLGEAAERVVARHRTHLRDPAKAASGVVTPVAEPHPGPQADLRTGPLAERIRHRHAAIHKLLEQGHDLKGIARDLGLARNTVRKFARATTPEELLVNTGTGRRPKILDQHAAYLLRRWNEGCTNAAQLHRELRDQGHQIRSSAVRAYVRAWRVATPAAPRPPVPATVRKATGWLLRDPAHLTQDEQRQLDAFTQADPALAALRTHISAFAVMMLDRQGQHLDAWMDAVENDDLPELRSFANGLRRDYDAARAGLTLPYSSGPVEGHVNRIKMIKRQMYGRANPDLLRKRILHGD